MASSLSAPRNDILPPVSKRTLRKCFLIRIFRRHHPQRAPDTGQVHHSVTGNGGMFEVPTQAPLAPQPTEGPLHHPAAGQHGKAFGVCRTAHHLQA
ncbi:MAG: hypothetical protein FJ147_12905, partial [Deltaproteobacteria bacterium]|nr:hypothetical protein [Deltaproteobacteria bacterium]